MIALLRRRNNKIITGIVLLLIAALSVIGALYFHQTDVNAAYISSHYNSIKIPKIFKLEQASVSDAVVDYSSLPAAGEYKYSVATGVSSLDALKILESELKREGYKTEGIKTYTVNGSLLYDLVARGYTLYLGYQIIEETPQSTVRSPDNKILTVFATHQK